MKIKEVSEEILKEGLMFPSSKTSYKKESPKRWRNKQFRTGSSTYAPRACKMCAGYEPCTRACQNMPMLLIMRLGNAESESELIFFLHFLSGLSQNFNLNLVWNFLINTKPLTHYFPFRTKRLKSKARTRSFKGGVSLPTLSL